jgi:hypothetical protein
MIGKIVSINAAVKIPRYPKCKIKLVTKLTVSFIKVEREVIANDIIVNVEINTKYQLMKVKEYS